MYSRLEVLIENYNQAVQNFNWAETKYLSEAICNLTVAESDLKKEIEEGGNDSVCDLLHAVPRLYGGVPLWLERKMDKRKALGQGTFS